MRSWFPLAAEAAALAALAVTEAVILEEEERFLSQRRSIRARPRQRRNCPRSLRWPGSNLFPTSVSDGVLHFLATS